MPLTIAVASFPVPQSCQNRATSVQGVRRRVADGRLPRYDRPGPNGIRTRVSTLRRRFGFQLIRYVS